MAGVAGRFMPTDYAAVKANIDAFQKPIFEQARRLGHHDETPAAHRADAVMASAAAASTIGLAAEPVTEPVTEPPAVEPVVARPVDEPVVEPTVEPVVPAAPESSSTVNWNAIILIDGTALARGYAAPGETFRIPWLGDVSVDWVKSILPDALIDVLVHNGVDITTCASATRSTPRPIKVAVKVRDGFNCVVRDCHRNQHLERDHTENFADTHDTSYPNLTSH